MRNKENKIWSGFLTNLLGVILGIVLTFGVSSLWQQCEEKKKTKEILILVRNELETNKEWFKIQEKIMRKDSYVYKKILESKSDWTSIPQDTLAVYLTRTVALEFSQLTTSAWHIFQNSDMIQKMTNKELIIRLTDCYYWINKIEELIMQQYWDNKKKAIPSEPDPYKYFDAILNNKTSVFFYTMMSSDTFSSTIWNIFPWIDALIDYTIMILDKHGDYRYDMDEKDKELESFIDARMDSVRHKMIP